MSLQFCTEKVTEQSITPHLLIATHDSGVFLSYSILVIFFQSLNPSLFRSLVSLWKLLYPFDHPFYSFLKFFPYSITVVIHSVFKTIDLLHDVLMLCSFVLCSISNTRKGSFCFSDSHSSQSCHFHKAIFIISILYSPCS